MSAPIISGLPQNQTLREGQTLELTCSSLDGSPSPHLRWYLGDGRQEIPNTNFTSKPHAQSRLRLTVSREDNDREYR